MKVNSVPAKQGLNWIKESLVLYKKNPVLWSVTALVVIIFPLLISRWVPGIGSLIGDYIQALLWLGFFQIFFEIKRTNEFKFSLLFSVFANSELTLNILWLKILSYVGVLVLLASQVALDLTLGLTMRDFSSVIQLLQSKSLYLIPESLWFILMINAGVIFVGFLLGMAALTFAGPLIAFHHQGIWKALQMSFHANMKNIGVFSVWILTIIPLFILGILSLGLGLLVLLPLLNISICLAYRDLFPPPKTT